MLAFALCAESVSAEGDGLLSVTLSARDDCMRRGLLFRKCFKKLTVDRLCGFVCRLGLRTVFAYNPFCLCITRSVGGGGGGGGVT